MALMRDETGLRTEMPTPLRLDEARDRGQVPRSSDLVSAVVLLAGLAGLGVFGPRLGESLGELVGVCLSSAGARLAEAPSLSGAGGSAVGGVATAALPIVMLPMIAASLVNVIQTGMVGSFEAIRPNWARISPAAGMRRIFSMRSWVVIAFALAKIAIAVGICIAALSGGMAELLSASGAGAGELAERAGSMVVDLGIKLGAALMGLALIDWVYQRWQHTQDLKITRRELLDDLRRMVGDPRLAGRRKRLAEELAAQRLSVELPSASVIVEVPGGAVVALKHNPQTDRTRVIARGQESLAGRIREIAVRYKLQVVANKELTVSLYRACNVGDVVPAKLRRAAADICRTKRKTDDD